MMKKLLHSGASGRRGALTLLRSGIAVLAATMFAVTAASGSVDTVAKPQSRISLEMKNSSMEDIINTIRNISDYRFLYSVDEIAPYTLRNFRVVDATLPEVMRELLHNTNLSYEVENSVVMIVPRRQQQQRVQEQPRQVTITGRVTDSRNTPLAGVSVVVKDTYRGVSTDSNGHYSLTAPHAQGMTLIFSYIGMKTQEVAYTGQAEVNVVLETDTQQIGEVVVTGIFERAKEGFTGSSTTLDTEQIRQLTSQNVLQALAIVDPGFKMTMSNLSGSNPSAIPDFQIRGQSSMGDYVQDPVYLRGDYNSRPNQPLFVLDGIIGVDVTEITSLDPEQVASITLLKDAAATVIYGSQAANGVVVVETVAPRPGKLNVSYNGNYGISMPDLSDYNLTNAKEKLQVEIAAGYFDGNDVELQNYLAELQLELLRKVDTDWLCQPLRNAFTHRHGVNIEGGEQSLRYKVYLGAGFQPGVMKGTSLNTQSAKVDLRYNTGDFVIMNQTYLDYGRSDRESPYGTFDLYANMNPYYTPYDNNGNIKKTLNPSNIHFPGYYDNTETLNPMWNTLFESKNRSRDFTVKEAIQVRYSPANKFHVELDFDITKTFGRVDVFKSANHTTMAYAATPKEKGRYDFTTSEQTKWNLALTGSWNRNFLNAHMVTLNARFTIGENDYYRLTEVRTGFPNDRLSEVFMGTEINKELSGGSESLSRNVGIVFTGGYSYKNRYAVDVSVRADAATQFGRDNRWAPFVSVGGKWNIHNESFLKKSGAFNELVLRATYGITGSQDFNTWQALQMYYYGDTMSTYISSDVVGAILRGMGNPDLKWQKTDNYNLGFDLGLFDNRVMATVEYYYKYTHNTLLDFALPPSSGVKTVKDNLGSISNEGWEASLRFTPWRDVSRQAYWNVGINAGHNRSKIEKISNAMETMNSQIYAADDTDLTRPVPQYVNGASMTAIWGMKSLGIDPQSGEEIFLNRDGTQSMVWNSREVVKIGDRRPDVAGAVTTSFGYKGLSVTLAARYTIGGQIYNSTLADKIENVDLRGNVDKRVLYDRWTTAGDVVGFRRLDGSTDREKTKSTSRFVMTQNEFSLSSLNINYRLDRDQNPFIAKMGLSSATVGLYVADLFKVSTIKMERGIYYPFTHQVSLSLNLIF